MRPIDLDKAISELKTLPEQDRLELMGVYDLLKSMPTIDVEPVVRCKDCRYGTQSKQEPKDYFVRCIQNPFYPEHFHKNHYCGFGAKMNEEL